ncbi:DNA alkylation repair protein [Spongiivirga citrea]|uniref:DNA alkylation repair protein n=1 Tax=Spongiivirga citrea TaxID=1481457 RepID=A0A6M0CIF9_9FLAO|nr:DNA alkylation repair protein [Spongiivirga citrea]NER15744.1 DNA alkylation repair protein [Spongiivirga citrea]
MDDYLEILQSEFQKNADADTAAKQKAYLRDQFEFYGLTTTQRREIQKPFLIKTYLPEKSELEHLVKTLWERPQREYHYFAQELTFKYAKRLDKRDIDLIEYMVTHKSWWDTVDMIATKLLGPYFKKYPDEIEPKVKQWLASDNIWLQRCALLFQLKYKDDLDTDLLSRVINQLLGSKEFFINKAIGWVLREYGRTNPDWVINFVEATPNLHNLSRREGLRLIK